MPAAWCRSSSLYLLYCQRLLPGKSSWRHVVRWATQVAAQDSYIKAHAQSNRLPCKASPMRLCGSCVISSCNLNGASGSLPSLTSSIFLFKHRQASPVAAGRACIPHDPHEAVNECQKTHACVSDFGAKQEVVRCCSSNRAARSLHRDRSLQGCALVLKRGRLHRQEACMDALLKEGERPKHTAPNS